MAQFESVFALDSQQQVTQATGGATTAIAIGAGKRFAIWADGPWFFLAGDSTVSATTSTPSIPVGANMSMELGMGINTHISAYNNSGSTIHISILTARNS